MNSTSGTSLYNTYSSNGLSGLVSGMDTDSMVKKMLQGTQSKIDKQNQAKQRLLWKQTMYHDITKKINTLKSKYFDTSYGAKEAGNLCSSRFFNSMVSTVKSGDSIKVIGSSSDAFPGETTILVSELASATKLCSSVKMSGDQIITGKAIDVEAIKAALAEEDSTLSFDLTFDGITKGIIISAADCVTEDGTQEITAETIHNAVVGKVQKAFGSYVTIDMADSKLSFSINIKDGEGKLEAGHELKITGAEALKFGITPGATSNLSTLSPLGKLSGISGKAYSFSINGEEFNFSSKDTVASMIKKINNSSAGVRISYSASTDSFSMVSNSTGAQYGISLSQSEGNLLSVLFGSDKVDGSATARSSNLNLTTVSGTALAADYTTNEAKMSFKVNGKDYTFSLARRETPYTAAEVETELNDWLKMTFGESNGTANISYADGKLHTAAGFSVSFEKTDIDTSDPAIVGLKAKSDLALAFGFSINGASNAVTSDTLISDVAGLAGMDFKNSAGDAAVKLSDIDSLTYVKDSTTQTQTVTFVDGRLSISGSGTVDLTGSGLEEFFGSEITLGEGKMSDHAVTAGSDAIVEINGVKTSRSSNTFTYMGLTLSATKISTEATVIGTERNVDEIVDTIKSFVSDYNTMIEEFYGFTTEDASYKNYAPLTDDQKKEMSDNEIELWTKKAKTGLLRNDSNVSSFLQSLRSAFYTKVESAGLSGYSIGLETTENSLSGKITIDEPLLRNAIASSPGDVEKLFTDPDNGIATVIAKTCDAYAKLSVATPGVFVQIAGAKGYNGKSKNNDIYFQLDTIKNRLSTLETKYNKEKERYWDKFAQMESIIAQFNSQSSMISSTFSGY